MKRKRNNDKNELLKQKKKRFIEKGNINKQT